jgi:hypothetical protein
MADNTVINPPQPKYGINEVVYLRESALLGYIESVKIYRLWYDPKFLTTMYVFLFKKSQPAVQIAGDAIDLKSGHSITLPEGDLLTYSEALVIKGNVLKAELNKTEVELARSGLSSKIEIIENGNPTEPLDFGNIAVGDGAQRQYTITNTGTTDLIMKTPPVGLTGDNDFTVILQPSPILPPGDSAIFKIAFEPQQIGRRVAAALIVSNDKNCEESIFQIEGTGV